MSHSRCSVGIGRGLGHLERTEDAAPDLERVVDRLHAGREQRELVVTEVRLPCAGRDDEAVVRNLERVVQRARSVHDPALEIEAGDLRHLDADPRQPPQHVPQRRRDVAGRKHAGRDLVEQRLEQMVIAPIDERHVDIGVAEQPGRGKTAEAAAHNDDLMHAFPIPRCVRCARCERTPGRRLRALL